MTIPRKKLDSLATKVAHVFFKEQENMIYT
jgi:hypothetical protein